MHNLYIIYIYIYIYIYINKDNKNGVFISGILFLVVSFAVLGLA